ncbi:antitoxin Xre/MbcA/ParS toxin-binding domain-containing protein [Vreelandella piezotolerans]|uniref:antitoxin Xre/MbcA/ParS toxin-binding domain-containing protein n=1 Tax=Vreelandella piezotolerans TaxID=2609667 RepID=UPI0037A30539
MKKNIEQSIKLEMFNRIAYTSILAFQLWEQKEDALDWLSRPNQSLNGSIPLLLCETEIGMKEVHRVLNALEWAIPSNAFFMGLFCCDS